MARIPAMVTAMCAWAACEGGSGITAATVATLPASEGYSLGFDLDGAPIVGTRWSAHAVDRPFEVTALGADLDGAPLVVHRVGTGSASEVWRLEPGGTAVQLGDRAMGVFRQVFQVASGTRYLVGNQTWVLRPGSPSWLPSPIQMFAASRASDGRFYAVTPTGFVRIEDDDTPTTILPCAGIPSPCEVAIFGVDRPGRLYLPRETDLQVFDPLTGAAESVALGRMTTNLLVVEDRIMVAAFTEETTGHELLVVPTLGDGPIMPARAAVPLDLFPVRFHVDPAGTVYVTHKNWLGRIVETSTP
jgi:hypothetical protein